MHHHPAFVPSELLQLSAQVRVGPPPGVAPFRENLITALPMLGRAMRYLCVECCYYEYSAADGRRRRPRLGEARLDTLVLAKGSSLAWPGLALVICG